MTKSALSFASAAAALSLGACNLVVTAADGGGLCHSATQSCELPTDCCEGFICVVGRCIFQGGGNNGTASSSSSGGSSVSGTTGHASGGTSGGSTHESGGKTSGGTSSGSSSGASGSSGGGSGGACAEVGASCQNEPCCDPYRPDGGGGQVCLYGESCQSCEAQNSFCELNTDCCAGLSCIEEACVPTPTCTPYDESCETVGCCAGLTCDSTYHYCYVPEGGSCTGAEAICATPYTCLSSGLCGTAQACSAYETSCATNPCCDGLTCSSGVCYVGYDEPCNGSETVCASPYTCLSSGVCGTAPSCSPYGTQGCETSGVACCSGYTCDTTYDYCFISYGDYCSGGYQCASPYTCLADGYCGTAPACSAYATSCATTGCCAGLTCDTNNDACYVAASYSCSGSDTVCAPPDTCLSSGVCGTAPTCSAYGTYGCESSGIACCAGLTCDTTYDYCYAAYDEPCSSEVCAQPYSCLSDGYCGTASCSAYGTSGCETSGVACCAGLTCDTTYDSCLVAYDEPCSGETCATPYTCLSDGYCGAASCSAYGTSGCETSGIACCAGLTCDTTYNSCLVAYDEPCTGETCAAPYTCTGEIGGDFCL